MGRRKSQSRPPAKKPAPTCLDLRLERRLLSYALAATAAGVGALVGSQRAEAKVVYTNMWIPIPASLDLNNDGIADFQLSTKQLRGSKNCFTSDREISCVSMKVVPQNQTNAIWGTQGFASVLGSGVSVGSQGKFQAGHEFMAKETYRSSEGGRVAYRSSGPWKQTTRGFLGLKFIIQGQVHFGWARLDVTATTRGMYGAITGYAYETEPNKPILTGHENGANRHKIGRAPAPPGAPTIVPGGLGLLAGGAPGLQAQRTQGPNPK